MIRAKHILFLNHAYGLSGSVISLGYIVKAFTQNGYKVFVVQKMNDIGASYLRECGATVFCVYFSFGISLCSTVEKDLICPLDLILFLKNIIKILFGILLTWRYIVKVNPSLLYLNEYVLVHCSLIAKIMNIPTVMHIRGPILHGSWGIRRWFLRKMILKWNDKIIAITETDSKQIFQKKSVCDLNSNPCTVITIYEFVKEIIPTDNLKYSIKVTSNFQPHNKVVTMLGGVSIIKGTLEFVRAANYLSTYYKDIIFVIAGPIYCDYGRCSAIKRFSINKKYKDAVFQFVERHNLLERVKFVGEIRNIEELLRVTDVLVFPSTISHFARPVIEAWSFKKPVIMTDSTHARELIKNDVDGLLVKNRNPKALAETIYRVLCNRALAQHLGENGYKKMKRLFDADANLRKLIDTCESMINH